MKKEEYQLNIYGLWKPVKIVRKEKKWIKYIKIKYSKKKRGVKMHNYKYCYKLYENGYLEGTSQEKLLNRKIAELELRLNNNRIIIERFNKALIYIQNKILYSEENNIECSIDAFEVLDIMLGIEEGV